MKNILFIVFGFAILLGCDSNDNHDTLQKDDYLIFGHFYGMCIGESCIEIFKLTENALYEDTVDSYTMESFDFETLLDTDTFGAVKDLTDYFPQNLWSKNEAIIGCPDCADGGGLYIEYSKKGTVKKWRIDQTKQNIPDYLHEFVGMVNKKIALINKVNQ
ncbi:MAG: hypothetical protein ACK5MZ_00350 [Aestuariibaculum sp.]